MDDNARARFRSRWRETFEGDPSRSAIYKDMGNGIASAGIEYYLPLFLKKLRRCLIMCQSTLTSRIRQRG
jgi:transcription-repair coupling factor (superfamily II helicase)